MGVGWRGEADIVCFAGGMIASTTRGGTNMKQRVLNYSLHDPSLEFVQDAKSSSSSSSGPTRPPFSR